MADTSAPAIPALKLPEVPKQKTISVSSDLQDRLRKDAPTQQQVEKTWVWFGALPHVGRRAIRIHGKGDYIDPMVDQTNRDMPGKEMDAAQAWLSPEDHQRPPTWMGRCPWFQNISVKYCTFNAYSTRVTRTGLEAIGAIGANRSAKAGEVKEFSQAEIDRILLEVSHTFIKPPLNDSRPETAIIYRVVEDPNNKGKFISEQQLNNPLSPILINMNTDICVADLVYMVPIVNPGNWPDLTSVLVNPPPSLSGR